MNLTKATVACVALGLLLAAAARADVPKAAPVPQTLSEAVRKPLEARSAALRDLYAALVAKNEVFAKQYGDRDLVKGSPEAHAAVQAMDELKAAQDGYIADVQKFNKDVAAAEEEAKAVRDVSNDVTRLIAKTTPTAGKVKDPAAGGKALAWEDGHPERKAWSEELRKTIEPNLDKLEMAPEEEIKKFAPNYKSLSRSRRIDVWASLLVAIASFESPGYKTNLINSDDDPPSVGLLQISYENQGFKPYGLEPLKKEAKSLEDPLVNLRCGVKILAYWVARDGVIASGSSLKDGRGGARYWSTLWEGKGHHIAEIQEAVKQQAQAE